MDLETFNYNLPPELIAQKPHVPRDECGLFVFNKNTNNIEHKVFKDIVDYINENDLIVLNNTKVIPAKLIAHKKSGGKIKILLTEEIEKNKFKCLTKGKLKGSVSVVLRDDIKAIIVKGEDKERIIHFTNTDNIKKHLNKIGEMPLPPYIKRDYVGYDRKKDFKDYQCVYAKEEGSIAAPTAGLHFTKDLIDKIAKKGIQMVYVTLHIGIGTFSPIREKKIENHKMHYEFFEISKETAKIINDAKLSKKRIIAIGTTVVRALESVSDKNGLISQFSGTTNLFIYPGFKYKIIDAIITNFHLPKSSLLMLISAFCGIENIMKCYTEAINQKYKFFSFGDAMFIY